MKSDLKIIIEAGGKRFSLNCLRLPDRTYLVKRGRKLSQKMPRATLTQLFETSRVWAVKQV